MADCARHAKVTQANMQTWKEISQSTTPRKRATGLQASRWILREGESIFSEDESLTGYTIVSGQP